MNKQFKIGDSASLSKTIHEGDINLMASITKDDNPIHLNEEYAKTTKFGARIAHGIFCNGVVSAVLGTILPGNDCIYIGQNLDYIKPVYIGDTIIAEVILRYITRNKYYSFSVKCTNQHGMLIAKGVSKILIP